jgi:phosphate starvation-inducible membrane PsiE
VRVILAFFEKALVSLVMRRNCTTTQFHFPTRYEIAVAARSAGRLVWDFLS